MKRTLTVMNEYAPEFSRKEKIAQFCKGAVIGFIVAFGYKYIIFPLVIELLNNGHCYQYGYFTGTHLGLYFIFVAQPIGSAILLFVFKWAWCVKVIRLSQNPLPGDKVGGKTKYKYGLRAKIGPYLYIISMVFLVCISIQGVFWANSLIPASGSNPPC